MEGRPATGKPLRRVESDVNVRKFAWHIGGPAFPGVQGRVAHISLVYPHGAELPQDPAIAEQLRKEAAMAGQNASLVKELRGDKQTFSQRLKKFLAED